MKTIYVLTEGSYSDYHIIGVYSTKELAEKAQFVFVDAGIEEYSLDDLPNFPPGMRAWGVDISDESKEILGVNQLQPHILNNSSYPLVEKYNYRVDFGEPILQGYFVRCWAKDEDHAKKIALDKYYQFKAEEAGIA